MRKFTIIFLLFSIAVYSQVDIKYPTFFEKGNGNTSADYDEIIRYYNLLDADFATIKVKKMGLTDSGLPLHIVVFSSDKNFDFSILSSKKTVILINNGIHAGEPDGIDASMQLFRDMALKKIKMTDDVVVVAIPVYNVGGCLNRNSTSRVNQNGPEEYGFRGNARNFDLNRDFIKTDTKNTKSFIEIYQLLKPAIFIDNHVSNGADYQYTLTYIMSEPKKLGNVLGDYVKNEVTAAITQNLKTKKIETTPYVNVDGTTPDSGFTQFFDSPRYTTGYTSLFNSVGYVVETHMLKNYASRVRVTYEFMASTIDFAIKNNIVLKVKRDANLEQFQPKQKYVLKWTIDSTKVTKMPFLGYAAGYKKSDVTNGQRLFYDKNQPFQKQIDFYGSYKAVNEIVIPDFYVIPKAYDNITDLLKLNKIIYRLLKKDTIIEVQSYRILDYSTTKKPYEGHYPHSATKVATSKVKKKFFKGDFLISTKQEGVKYLLETLEPEAVDSFFNWNFFDTILQQKEGYSEYVFEDLANDFLNENPQVRQTLETKKKEDKKFAENIDAQLEWVHKNSPFYEKEHLQYPIYRIMN